MTLTLALETASIRYGVAVAEGSSVLAHRSQRRDEQGFPGLSTFVEDVLSAAGVRFAALGRIAVDIGPGNLGSVRAGVAYANALAYGRGIPVVSVNALEVLAAGVERAPDTPVLCLRPAGNGEVFAGWFPVDAPATLCHGPLAEVLATCVSRTSAITVAGVGRNAVAEWLPHVAVTDSGVEFPDVRELARLASDGELGSDHATPVTVSSLILDGGHGWS